MKFEQIMFIGGPNHGERRSVAKGVRTEPVIQREMLTTAEAMARPVVEASPVNSVLYTRRIMFDGNDDLVEWFSPNGMSDSDAVRLMLAGCEKPRP